MSSMDMPALSTLIAGLLTQVAMLAVWAVGLLLAVIRWRRHPRASALLVAGLVVHLFLSVVGIGLNVALPWLVHSGSGARVGVILQIVTVVRSLIGAVGWGLVLAGAFADRGR
ncbi:MAG TPA: hypothetical protein GX714_17230 [Chloroflexi bacterium]|jgi:ABC-type polysaccharide/polyol phosphate export permease|nr:hypothetical protein [Chloroflexota bacterium]